MLVPVPLLRNAANDASGAVFGRRLAARPSAVLPSRHGETDAGSQSRPLRGAGATRPAAPGPAGRPHAPANAGGVRRPDASGRARTPGTRDGRGTTPPLPDSLGPARQRQNHLGIADRALDPGALRALLGSALRCA